MPEFAIRPHAPSAVARCAADDAELLQSMADDGLSRQVIADLFGLSRPAINVRMRQLDRWGVAQLRKVLTPQMQNPTTAATVTGLLTTTTEKE